MSLKNTTANDDFRKAKKIGKTYIDYLLEDQSRYGYDHRKVINNLRGLKKDDLNINPI